MFITLVDVSASNTGTNSDGEYFRNLTVLICNSLSVLDVSL